MAILAIGKERRSMSFIIKLLLKDYFESAIEYLDGFIMDMADIVFYAEETMGALIGTSGFSKVYNVVYVFGVSLIVIKFLKKGLGRYVFWTEGDPEVETLIMLTGFVKALAISTCFPSIYGWMIEFTKEFMESIFKAINLDMTMGVSSFLAAIAMDLTSNFFAVILSVVYLIIFIILFIKFIKTGFEMFIMRVGIPIACVGLLDQDDGLFRTYIQRFYQVLLGVIIQIIAVKLSMALMINANVFWGIAAISMALGAQEFLKEFVVTTNAGSGITNKIYTTARIANVGRSLVK